MTDSVAARRAATLGALPREGRTPNGDAARRVGFSAQMRAQLVKHGDRDMYQVEGYASATDQPYTMWDAFGEYEEVVQKGAFAKTLAATPDVPFLVNHAGVTMARTTNGTLTLEEDALGLRSVALLNPERQDVRDLISAIGDKLITEMSFAFMIDDAEWTNDFTRFEIRSVDINRGDVSAVNFGANPYTSIAARSREVLRDVERLPEGAQMAALRSLQRRHEPLSRGSMVSTLDAWIATQEARRDY